MNSDNINTSSTVEDFITFLWLNVTHKLCQTADMYMY